MFSTLNFKSQVDLFFFFGSSNSVSVYVIFSWAPKENRKAFIKGRLFKECYFYTFIFNSLSRHLKRLFHVNKEAYIIKLLLKIRTLLKIPEKKKPTKFLLRAGNVSRDEVQEKVYGSDLGSFLRLR